MTQAATNGQAPAEVAEPTPTKISQGELDRLLAIERKAEEISPEKLALMGRLQAAVETARVVADLRKAITPELLRVIRALENTKLGYMTDRGPGKKISEPYDDWTVRECLVECLIRGFRVINNEFNIIAEGFYAAKNGLARKVAEHPGLTNFKLVMGLPDVCKGGMGVPCEATWLLNGTADSLSQAFCIKVFESTGADAILGKAERKILNAVHKKLTGSAFITPEGEVEETGGGASVAREDQTQKTSSLAAKLANLGATENGHTNGARPLCDVDKGKSEPHPLAPKAEGGAAEDVSPSAGPVEAPPFEPGSIEDLEYKLALAKSAKANLNTPRGVAPAGQSAPVTKQKAAAGSGAAPRGAGLLPHIAGPDDPTDLLAGTTPTSQPMPDTGNPCPKPDRSRKRVGVDLTA